VAKAFAQARKDAGLPKSIVLYCGRHTFGTAALSRTGDLSAVMKAMGHSSVQVTMGYLHPGLNAIRDAMDKKNAETLERHNLRHSPEEGSPEQRASA
jgi:integrase